MALTVEQARTALASKLGGASARPALTDPELDAILAAYALRDTDGRAPVDDGWSPTYAMNAAAAEGWRQKAARVAADFNFSADGASFSKGEVLARCLEMEAHYAALDTSRVGDPVSTDYPSRRLWL